MWCPKCQTEVAVEVSADIDQLSCTTCGSTLTSAALNAGTDRPRDAQALLRRWSSNHLTDPFGPVSAGKTKSPAEPSVREGEGQSVPVGPTAKSRLAHSPGVESQRPETAGPKPRFRIDGMHAAGATSAGEAPAVEKASAEKSAPPPAGERTDSRHDSLVRGPHWSTSSLISSELQEERGTNWVGLAGQLAAYAGVLGLTIGTTLVLWGYFGGPVGYTTTGWLVTTAGQMLLFLGVVTLVAGGMEQTTEEVARRIDVLGEKILRFEQASREHALRGPSIPAENFADDSSQTQTKRESVTEDVA